MAHSLWQILQTYSKTCIFYVKLYKGSHRQSVRGALTVLVKSLKIVSDEVHFITHMLYQNSIKEFQDDLEH